MDPAEPAPRLRPIEVRWLVRLRWAAVAAQLASILGVKYLLRAPFPARPLVLIVGLLAVANVALARALRAGRTLSDAAITANLLLDIAALTALLVWTGGAMNPFTTLYLLHVALAAILVPRRWSMVVTLAAALAFGGLLLARPEAIHVWHSGAMFMLHVRGMWLAFALTAACLWVFVDRVSMALRRREAELSAARLRSLRAEQLAALGTLAAGTAHELNTPLGTVAVLAAELSDLLAASPDARAHADKIRGEVRRCKDILSRMRSQELLGEPRTEVALSAWIDDAAAAWRARHADVPLRVAVAADAGALRAQIWPDRLRQALHSVLDNARLATLESGAGAPVELRVTRTDAGAAVAVIDAGPGVAAEHLARLGEPFFTTRQPGSGMGLGLFLVQTTLAQHDGAFAVASRPGRTEVRLSLPAAPPPAPAPAAALGLTVTA